MKRLDILIKAILVSLLFVVFGMQAIFAEPYTATDSSSNMWAVQGSTSENPVIYHKSQEELFVPSQVNGKMEVKQYKLPEDTKWVGVANSYVYLYSDSRVIKKYNLGTGKAQDIVKIADTFAEPYSDGKYVYYLKGTQLLAIDPKTDKSRTVLTVPGLKGFSTSYSAKNRALIYNISVVDGYFYYVLSKTQVVANKSVHIPTVLYRVPLNGPLVPETLLKFPENNGYRAPGLPYLIKDNMLVMANETVMYDLKAKKYIQINNSCLYTYITGNHVYQQMPDGSYQEMNISNGSFIENQVYKSTTLIPNNFGDYNAAEDSDIYITRFTNNKTNEKKYFGTVKLEKYDYYELWLIGDGAAYTPISDPQKRAAFEKALKVVRELIKPGMNDFEKELVLHDWIVDNISFDYDTLNGTKDTSESYSWVGLFNNNLAVSAGYASGFNILLNLAGVASEYVTGTGVDGGVNSWNVVYINGKWYQADTAMDDIESGENGGIGRYRYFNLPSNMSKHNTPSRWYSKTTDIDDNFFYKKSIRVKSIEELKQVLTDKRNDNAIYVIFEGFKPTSEQLNSYEITNLLPGYSVMNYSETIYLNEYKDIYKFVIVKS